MIFKRKIYQKLLEWKKESHGESALLIKGARRVGKSTIAEEFGKREYDSYIVIDFAECPKEVIVLFEDISDLDYIFMRLQMIYDKELKERKSLIIFDEIQLCPKARQAIKYLVKDGRYDYIETGSLLSIRQNVKGIIIPSEEEEITLNPLDYEEFRWAMGDKVSVPLLRQFFDKRKGMGEAANRSTMRDFRLYMLVGGMPQAVSTYIETNNLAKVDHIKRNIINLYEKDFNKIDRSGNASKIFHAIPSQLLANASRYIVATATGGGRKNRLEETISDMEDSMVVNIAYHVDDPNVGMAQTMNKSAFKMFVADTGLFVTLAFWDKEFTENVIYEKLLSDKLPANLGYVYENVVAQIIKASGYELYYHTFPTEDGKHNYEIDFIIPDGDKIDPIEIKSSGYNRHKSLDAFFQKYHARIKQQYMIYTKDLRTDEMITGLPVYFTQFL
ncbi:MAG: ATP-binding protein [Marinilabiliaceae bacterium]|nr:ATP-binding protein [Marinilabiliaceae bacterium]